MAILKPADRAADVRLGRALRALRHERGMTLREVAAAAGLSQPFVSQLELGRARPSMRSLFGLAAALGTTQQALLARAAAPDGGPPAGPVRGADAPLVGWAGDAAGAGARLLLHADGADVSEFVGAAPEFGEYFAHGRHELLYVVRGSVEVDLDGRRSLLGERDSLGYAATVPHRWRQVGDVECVVLVVHTGA